MEVVGEPPADKRACNSQDFTSGASSAQAQQANGNTDADMDTSSSASPSSRSDGEQDREEEEEEESDYGSCDSDDEDPRRRVLQRYQRGRSTGDQLKLKSLASRLSEENDPSLQLTGLTELCEVLSFCTEDSLSIEIGRPHV